MAKEILKIGAPGAGGGDTYFTGLTKVKANFDELYDAKVITGAAKFDSPAGNFGETPLAPRTTAAIPLNKTDAVNAGTCGIYYRGPVLTKDSFTGGIIVIFSGENVLNELCFIWVIYDKVNDCFSINIQSGATGDLPGAIVETAGTLVITDSGEVAGTLVIT